MTIGRDAPVTVYEMLIAMNCAGITVRGVGLHRCRACESGAISVLGALRG